MASHNTRKRRSHSLTKYVRKVQKVASKNCKDSPNRHSDESKGPTAKTRKAISDENFKFIKRTTRTTVELLRCGDIQLMEEHLQTIEAKSVETQSKLVTRFVTKLDGVNLVIDSVRKLKEESLTGILVLQFIGNRSETVQEFVDEGGLNWILEIFMHTFFGSPEGRRIVADATAQILKYLDTGHQHQLISAGVLVYMIDAIDIYGPRISFLSVILQLLQHKTLNIIAVPHLLKRDIVGFLLTFLQDSDNHLNLRSDVIDLMLNILVTFLQITRPTENVYQKYVDGYKFVCAELSKMCDDTKVLCVRLKKLISGD